MEKDVRCEGQGTYTSGRIMMAPRLAVALAFVALIVDTAARAESPDAKTLMADFGLADADVKRVVGGEMVAGTLPPSNERELVATLVFLIEGATPGEVVDRTADGLLDRVDPNTIAYQVLGDSAGVAAFAKLTLAPDREKRARAYATAEPGEALNLSAEEIAALGKLGASAPPSAVEERIRGALLARLQAYRSKGLAGIAPYARSGGKTRSPADDLRSATQALKLVEKYMPSAHRVLLDDPSGKPPGTEERFRWSQIKAHGVPTILLTHNLYIPDGDAWLAVQRQFYVSTGYNCEQAVAAFLPVQKGTAVFYVNRTSTDQVAGFGGGAKRSIGGKLLTSQLEALFQKARANAGDPAR
jgi:hypothetical protein